eukprot:3379345-Alexandrium_andersonii.AAC.1
MGVSQGVEGAPDGPGASAEPPVGAERGFQPSFGVYRAVCKVAGAAVAAEPQHSEPGQGVPQGVPAVSS